jgi:hypothetical protein
MRKMDESLPAYMGRLNSNSNAQSAKNIIEIGAGLGRLSLALRENGVDIYPTDISPKNNDIEKLSADEALVKYNPEIVVGAWLPYDGNIEIKILNHKSTEYFLYICQVSNGISGNERIWSDRKWEVIPLSEANNYSLCRYDFLSPNGEIVKHSESFLFKKKTSV